MTISNLATKYGFQSFPHFTAGRSGAKINKIVIHHMATTNYDSVPSIWQTRAASAHYGIGAKGEIRAYVMKLTLRGTQVIGMPTFQV